MKHTLLFFIFLLCCTLSPAAEPTATELQQAHPLPSSCSTGWFMANKQASTGATEWYYVDVSSQTTIEIALLSPGHAKGNIVMYHNNGDIPIELPAHSDADGTSEPGPLGVACVHTFSPESGGRYYIGVEGVPSGETLSILARAPHGITVSLPPAGGLSQGGYGNTTPNNTTQGIGDIGIDHTSSENQNELNVTHLVMLIALFILIGVLVALIIAFTRRPEDSGTLVIKVYHPDSTHTKYPMPLSSVCSSTPLYIGRSRSCTIQVPDNMVSRQHIELTAQGEILNVRDLDSKHGTIINGRKITTHQHPLNQGKLRIYFGNSRITIKHVPPSRPH